MTNQQLAQQLADQLADERAVNALRDRAAELLRDHNGFARAHAEWLSIVRRMGADHDRDAIEQARVGFLRSIVERHESERGR